MHSNIDYVIVGSGLTGATVARKLFNKGYEVLVIERRKTVGGNVQDYKHDSGINVHAYGPHYFRTSSKVIWDFVNKFSSFYEYVALVKSFVDGRYENWPIAASYIRDHVGEKWAPSFTGVPRNFEEAALAMMPERIYHKFIKEYSIKQWGTAPKELAPGLIKRFDVRLDDDPRLKPNHIYQGIPEEGYSGLMRNMLKGIPVLLNTDYLKIRNTITFKKMLIYTGAIDEYFDFNLGKLKYRGQERTHEFLEDTQWYQPCGQVNNPALDNGPFIRTLEWKHMMPSQQAAKIKGTLITREVTVSPDSPEHYEYPFPDRENAELYKRYKIQADAIKDILICGRLGEYRYYDMDQAIGRALFLLKNKILVTHLA